MSQKTVIANVYGKEYLLACDAGQEQHLQGLVQEINARASQLEKAVGKLPEPLMLLYTSLMVADELHDAKRDLTRTREELAHTRQQVAQNGDDARFAALEEDMAHSLSIIAGRIEGLADKLAA